MLHIIVKNPKTYRKPQNSTTFHSSVTGYYIISCDIKWLEIFKFNEKNYINAQNTLEQEVVDYSSDENKEEFGIYKNQEVPPLLLTAVEDIINCKLMVKLD
ncbi:unnamed protein product [Rhizophagus irregularis]|nr:unnamed protein product [Rhizophagus irregularis]CAB4434056.1 unnamed protein product [Rhizophagus irregularis]